MEAKELMIGDILNLSDNDDWIIPCRVVELHTEELLIIQPDDTACDIVGYDMVRPMRLTPEILEKNGWEWVSHRDDEKGTMDDMFYGRVGHIYFYSDGYAEADIIGYGIGYNGNGKFRGKTNYVHELQRVLRCCGLLDLAENFKVD